MGFVADAHDDTVFGFRGDFQCLRPVLPGQYQGMIAGRRKRVFDGLEQALPIVMDRAQFAVHGFWRAHHAAAERLADGLEPEADTEQRNPAGGCGNQIQAYSGLIGLARPRRKADGFGLKCQRFAGAESIVAVSNNVRAQFTEIVF